jgi:tetratricopeptide (TPR) repeat protein
LISKARFVTAFICVLVFLAGIFSGWMLSERLQKTAIAFGVAELLIEEANLLENIYYSSIDEEIKLAVLKHFLSFAEETTVAAALLTGDKANKMDIAFTNVQIGLILQKLNRHNESAIYFERAVKAKPDNSVEKLIQVVKRLDESVVENLRKDNPQ